MERNEHAKMTADAAAVLLEALLQLQQGWARHAPGIVDQETGVVYWSLPTLWLRMLTNNEVTEDVDPGAQSLIEIGVLDEEELKTLWLLNDRNEVWSTFAEQVEWFAYAMVFRAMNPEWFGARLYPAMREIRKHKITLHELFESSFVLDTGSDYGLHFTRFPKRLWPTQPARAAYATLRGRAA